MEKTKIRKMANGKCKNRENATKEIWGREINDKHLDTRASPGGKVLGRSDYIINAKCRDADRTAKSNTMACANDPEPAAPSPYDATLLQRREEILSANNRRNREDAKI